MENQKVSFVNYPFPLTKMNWAIPKEQFDQLYIDSRNDFLMENRLSEGWESRLWVKLIRNYTLKTAQRIFRRRLNKFNMI